MLERTHKFPQSWLLCYFFKCNFKFNLITQALFSINSFTLAIISFQWHHNEFVMYVSRLIEKSISSAYGIVRLANLQSFGPSSGASINAMDTANSSVHGSFIDLPSELFQMLACAGPYLYLDTSLLQKVHCFILIF